MKEPEYVKVTIILETKDEIHTRTIPKATNVALFDERFDERINEPMFDDNVRFLRPIMTGGREVGIRLTPTFDRKTLYIDEVEKKDPTKATPEEMAHCVHCGADVVQVSIESRAAYMHTNGVRFWMQCIDG